MFIELYVKNIRLEFLNNLLFMYSDLKTNIFFIKLGCVDNRTRPH